MAAGRTAMVSRGMQIKDAVMPDDIGTLESWQFYIPGLTDAHINRMDRVISAHDMPALQAYFFG